MIASLLMSGELLIFLVLAMAVFSAKMAFSNWLLVLTILVVVAFGLLISQFKSAYLFFVLGVSIFILSCSFRIAFSVTTLRLFFGVLSLAMFCFSMFIFDFSFSDKNIAPKLVFFWVSLILLNGKKYFFGPLIFLDLIAALVTKSRGIFLGSLSALFPRSYRPRESIIFIGAIFFNLLYFLISPLVALIFPDQGYLDSASNYQRAALTKSALEFVLSNIFSFSDANIYAAAEGLAYSHDTDSLSVHSFFLAVGLYFGLIPMVVFLVAMSWALSKSRRSVFFPVLAFVFVLISLSPDSNYTRILLGYFVASYLISRSGCYSYA